MDSAAGSEQQLYQCTRERWNRWIGAANAAGLFRDPHGAELKSRLTGIDRDGFRSALAECMTCWALLSELGLHLQPRPSGRDGRVLEFAVQTREGEIGFEVKSPRLGSASLFGPDAEESTASLDAHSTIQATRTALRSANRQFAAGRRNVLVIAMPEIRKVNAARHFDEQPTPLIRALYGVPRAIVGSTGSAQLVVKGNFLQHPGGATRFTRVSAVVALEDSGWAKLRTGVLHNPASAQLVDASLFGKWRQFGGLDAGLRGFSSAVTGSSAYPL